MESSKRAKHKVRILLVHNYYQNPGGEDELFAAAGNVLRSHGHEVEEYVRRNHEIARCNLWQTTMLPVHTVWSSKTSWDLRQIFARKKPHLVHFYNTFPLISASAYYVCQEFGLPVVQSLDNARLACPGGNFRRDGNLCQDCLGKIPWRGVLHGCYHGSRLETGIVATMLSFHRLLNTWSSQVNLYLVATNFYRDKFIEAGLPAHKLHVKPHFLISDPGCGSGHGDYALYLGRLSPEKGIPVILRAWSALRHIPLRIRGDGPLLDEVRTFADRNPCVQWIPRLSPSDRFDLIRRSRFLVWPSEGFYETFGLVVAESFACGVPVIASRTGVAEEIVADGRTGLHFVAGNAEDLATKVEWAWSHPREMTAMGLTARKEYESRFTAAKGYEQLLEAYERAKEEQSARL